MFKGPFTAGFFFLFSKVCTERPKGLEDVIEQSGKGLKKRLSHWNLYLNLYPWFWRDVINGSTQVEKVSCNRSTKAEIPISAAPLASEQKLAQQK